MRIPDQEWRARVAAAKQVAKMNDLDVLILTSPENIYYYSGFRTMLYTRFCCVAIPAGDGDPALIIPSVDAHLALDDWWSPTWFSKESVRIYGPNRPVSDYMVFIREFVRPNARMGIDSMSFTAYMSMESGIPGLKASTVYDELNSLKQVKSESEIEAMRRANQIAIEAHKDVADFLTNRTRLGKATTEVDVAAEMDQFAKSQGSDGFGYPTLVSFGDKMLAPHSPPLRRIIPRNTVVRVAFGCAYEGYSADVIRTYVIGEPPASVRKLTDAHLVAQQACFEAVKPGITTGELLDLCTRIYTERGVLSGWDRMIGHGIGLTIHEPPRMQQGTPGWLRENMTVAIEPSLNGPEGGYSHCDVVRVTATGCENLSPGMFDLVVIKG